jgi:hypothetical protein
MDTATKRGLAAIAAAAETAEPAAELVSLESAVLDPGAAAHNKSAAPTGAASDSAVGMTAGDAKIERARIASIVNAPEAKGREGLAQHLAFNTEMSAPDAIAMLKAAPIAAAERTSRLDGKVPVPKVDAAEHADETANRSAGLAAAVTRQLAKIKKQPKAA